MIGAFGRLFRILIAVIIAALFGLVGLRTISSGQKYSPIDHPLLKLDFVWVGETSNEPRWLLWKLRLNEKREWQLLVNDKMESLPVPPPGYAIWLEVIDPTSSDKLNVLSEFIKNAKISQSVAFSSDYQKITREMRKIEPLWLYGSSVAESARVRLFASLYLETLANIDSDILVVDKIKSRRLIEELHRRHKKLFFLVRSQNEEDLALAQGLKTDQMIDGVIIRP